jgi:Flp pilus assembly protein TadD
MTWVSVRPADLAFLTGYCAVEAMDYELARTTLEIAVSLRPLDASAKSELAHTYVWLEEFDLADAIIGELIANLDDNCDLAREWRRRGYVRFEQGKLEEARQAYLTSLEFDPRNELALSELRLLNSEIERQGGAPLNYSPPENFQTTTECTV